MAQNNLHRTISVTDYGLFGSQAAPRVSYCTPGSDWYGSKPGWGGRTQNLCKMKDSKPTVIVSPNAAAEGLPLQERTTQFESVQSPPDLKNSSVGGPQDPFNEEDSFSIRAYIKDRLPQYKAPTDLKERIRSITSLKREDL
jgi:hypothetical protein